MAEEKFKPSPVNYTVCRYCKNRRIVTVYSHDGLLYACSENKTKDGKLRCIMAGPEYIDSSIGCEKFESSGLPAHPKVLESLIKQNPKCKSIPSDPDATEISWEFTDRADAVLMQANKDNGWGYVPGDATTLIHWKLK